MPSVVHDSVSDYIEMLCAFNQLKVDSLRHPHQATTRDCSGTLELDSCAIEEDSRYDGYFVIVTSETNWDDERIIDTYRELWRIEESFKISKSELKTRPVFVWTPKHIEAHFLICYIALVILRLLQLATDLPCSRIKEEISLMQGINVDANWWVFAHRSDASDRLSEAVGLEELKLKNLTLAKAKEIFAKAAKWELPQIK